MLPLIVISILLTLGFIIGISILLAKAVENDEDDDEY